MRGHRRPSVPLTTPAEFLAALRDCSLLPAHELFRLEQEHAEPALDVHRWAEELVRQQMITSYQAELLLEGRGEDLVLGPYRILDWLGAGGMGQVYKAEHTLMKRVVAVKVMAAEPLADGSPPHGRQPITYPSPFLVPRLAFLREVQAAARLQHPNIVLAFDATEVEGLLVLVMEYVEGIDLERLVGEHGPLPVALAGELVRQAAMGLQYAHERGLVHGDIKPSNLLLSKPGPPGTGLGVVKILDLGLARLAGQPHEDRVVVMAGGDCGQGQPSGLAGTPDFMAPELARDGRQASIRSDLYSLGCTFFYLLTGDVPFPADTWTEKLLRHQFDPPPALPALRAEVPPEIDAVVQQLLAKDPGQRHAAPAELASALEAWLSVPALPKAGQPAATGSPPSLLTESLVGPGVSGQSSSRSPVPAERARPAEATGWTADGSVATSAELLGERTSEPEPSGGGGESAPVEAPVPSARGATRGATMPPARRRLRTALAVLAAACVGLVAAGLLRLGLPARSAAPVAHAGRERETAPSPPASPFQLERTGERYASLAAVVAAARDGDRVVIHGDGPFRTPPLRWHGKTLTLCGAAGSRPRLQLDGSAAGDPGASLLATDSPLAIEGVDLERAAGGRTPGGSAHLVWCDQASLRLADCGLRVPRGSALVVVRGGTSVEVTDCRLTAGTLALCVEAGEDGPCAIRLAGSAIQIEDPAGAALSVWAPEGGRPAPVRLDLEKNCVHAGRVCALRALRGVEVAARGNRFTFRQALVSLVGFSGPEGWRRAVTWRGQDNVHHAGGGWLQVDGVPVAVRTLQEWQALWGEPEPGSVERAQ